jgi:hypothetical protein
MKIEINDCVFGKVTNRSNLDAAKAEVMFSRANTQKIELFRSHCGFTLNRTFIIRFKEQAN